MYISSAAVLLLLAVVARGASFNYKKQGADWTDASFKCLAKGSTKQSPADLLSTTSKKAAIKLEVVSNKGYHNFKVEQDMASIKVTPTGSADKLVLDKTDYPLSYVQLHAGSEHKLNGKQADLELQYVFESSSKKKAIMSFLFEGVKFLKGEITRAYILEALTGDSLAATKVHSFTSTDNRYDSFDQLMSFVHGNSTVLYHYSGSLTAPPCTEDVEWFVFGKTIGIPQFGIDNLQKKVAYAGTKGNYRDIPTKEYTSGIVMDMYDKNGYTLSLKSNSYQMSTMFSVASLIAMTSYFLF